MLVGGLWRSNFVVTGIVFGVTALCKSINCWWTRGDWKELGKELVIDGSGQLVGCVVGTYLLIATAPVLGPFALAAAVGGAMLTNFLTSYIVSSYLNKESKEELKQRKKDACLLLGVPDDSIDEELLDRRFRHLALYTDTNNTNRIDPRLKEIVDQIRQTMSNARDELKDIIVEEKKNNKGN